jgi:hypothetical protein
MSSLSRRGRPGKGVERARGGRSCLTLSVLALCSCAWGSGLSLARAGDLVTTLEVAGPPGKLTVTNAPIRLRPRQRVRPVWEGKADDEFTLHWTVSNAGPERFENVLVHFFVAAEDRAGQPEVPELLPDKVVVEGALTMDFASTNSSTGTVAFRIHEPGDYLVRLEARIAPGVALDEPVAALDLKVK